MCLLCLSGGGDFPSTNSPNWLVSNDDIAKKTFVKISGLLNCGLLLQKLLYLQSASLVTSTTAFSCASHTSVVFSDSRCSSVSPMQRITLRPASSEARVLVATSSEVSWKSVRRSEWPNRQKKKKRKKIIREAYPFFYDEMITKDNVWDSSVNELLWAVWVWVLENCRGHGGWKIYTWSPLWMRLTL